MLKQTQGYVGAPRLPKKLIIEQPRERLELYSLNSYN